ncbi:MAG: alpha/beta fold hydrolase [Luteimonas sp.]|nr:alpha/beta fold hydrolase [Luteimonas sp.]
MSKIHVEGLRTIVCLHSLFLSPAMFARLKEDVGERATVITPTFPGQAERLDEPTDTVTVDDCVRGVLLTLDGLEVKRFSIVAQSMGADVAVRIAARHPDRVERMVLMGASARAEPPEQRAAFASSADEVSRNGFGPGLADFFMGVLFGASTLADPAQAPMLADVRAQLGRLPPNFVHAARGVVERESAVDLLPLVRAPTLVVSGIEDLARPPSWSDELFDGIPDCQLWRLKRVGHSPALEAPSLVNPRIIDFLRIAA